MSSTTPAETDSLLDHIFFLTTIASTNKGDGKGDAGQIYELVHGEGDGFIDQTLDGKCMLIPGNTGTLAMVTNVVEGNGCYETLIQHFAYRRLAVEGVFTGESDEIGVAWDPIIGAAFVPCIDVCADMGLWKKMVLSLGDFV